MSLGLGKSKLATNFGKQEWIEAEPLVAYAFPSSASSCCDPGRF